MAIRFLALLLAACLTTTRAPAQEASPAPAPESTVSLDNDGLHEDWVFRFEPAIWYVSPGGRVDFRGQPVGAPELWLSDFNLDSPRISPFGELHLRATEIWRFSVSAFGLSLQDRGSEMPIDAFLGPEPIQRGTHTESSLNFASGDIVAAWRLPLELGERLQDFEGRIELIGGVRWMYVDLKIDSPTARIAEEHFFLQPMGGFKLNMEVTRRFVIDVQNTFGFFNDGGRKLSFSWDIIAGFMYYPIENLGLQIGYRQLLMRLQDGPEEDRFRWDGANAGIYGGLVFRF